MKKKSAPLRAAQRHDRFVAEYLVDRNATRAAIAAGYAKGSAHVTGSRLLRHAKVVAALAAGEAALAIRTGITQDRVLYELEHLVFSNIKHYVIDGKDELQLAEGAPKHAMAAVASFRRKPGEYGTEIEIKLWDKPGTLKLAGRHVGLFPDRLEVTGKDGKPLMPEASELSDAELKARLMDLAGKL